MGVDRKAIRRYARAAIAGAANAPVVATGPAAMDGDVPLPRPSDADAQVDCGQGAPTRTASSKNQRPVLFVIALKYSGKRFRKAVWQTSQVV